MLNNWAKRSANAASIRAAGDAEYARKRIARERTNKLADVRRRARVQAARSTLRASGEQQTILRHAHQYGAAVSKMNRAKLGKPNRMRKINRFPNPVPLRKREEMKREKIKKIRKSGQSKSEGRLGGPESSGVVNRASASLSIEREVERLEKAKQLKLAQDQQANNGWGMMSKYAAARLESEKKAERDRQNMSRTEMKAYLDAQVAKKQKYFSDHAAEQKFWLKKNNEDTEQWRMEQKRTKEKLLAKNLEIKRAREVQLNELERRRRQQALILKKEDERMMARQRREKARVAREKKAKIIAQQAALERVKQENMVTLAKKEAAKKLQWDEEARLDAQWKEILDKQEREREARLAEMHRKQQGLVAIGQKAAESNANNDAELEARIQRHRQELARKEDAKAAARVAKAKKMKDEMLSSIKEAINLKEEMQRKRAKQDAEFARRFISESNQALNEADDEVEKARR